MGVVLRRHDHATDLAVGHVDVADDFAGRRLAVAGSTDGGGAAALGIAAGIDAFERRLLRTLADDVDGAPLGGLQGRLGVLDDRVGGVAQRHDGQVGLHHFGAAAGDRAATARGVGFAQFDDVELGTGDEVGLVVADELAGGAQHLELDAFLQRVVKLLHPYRHLGLGAAIDDGDVAAEATRSARRVHGGVAATNDHDVLAPALGQRRLMALDGALHQVDAGQKLVGRHDVEQVLAGHVHEARQAGAGADKNLPEAGLLQIAEGGGLADNEVLDELAAEGLDLRDHVVDQFVGQAELGNAVTQHATKGVEGFEDSDREALGGQQIGVDEAGGTGADDRDRWLVGLDPGIGQIGELRGDAFGIDQLLALGQIPLELADLDRSLGVGADALTLKLLRADAAGDVGQRIAALDQFHRLAETAGTE